MSTNPVPGTQVQLAEEGNVFLWEVIMQGPEDSVYAVCDPTIPTPVTHNTDLSAERQVQDRSRTAQGVPLQTTHRLVQNQNLSPQRQQR